MLKTSQTIGTITRVLRRCADKVHLTNTWRSLHRLHGVGTLAGRSLILDEQDRLHLRQLLIHHIGFDPLIHNADALQGDRIERSQFRDEKVGGGKVSEGIVMVGSASGTLALASGTYHIPAGSTLNVPATELADSARIVLIENLTVMYALQRYHWPEAVRDLPMLFRGSPQVSPAAVTAALASEGILEVICFPDYDPQGLFNSLTLPKVTALLVPTSETIARLVDSNRDKPDDFWRQQQAREWLRSQPIPAVQRLLADELALSQESMAGETLELALAPHST